MPAVWRPQPGRPGRLAYVRSSADINIWRIETSAAGAAASSPPVVAIASTRRDSWRSFHLTVTGSHSFRIDRASQEVWVADASGANAIQLTSLGATPGFPRWSPDGRTIVFHSNSEPHPYGAVYVVTAEGGRVRQVTSNRRLTSSPASQRWRLDLLQLVRTGTPSIWKVPVSGGEASSSLSKPGSWGSSPETAPIFTLSRAEGSSRRGRCGAAAQGRRTGKTRRWRASHRLRCARRRDLLHRAAP